MKTNGAVASIKDSRLSLQVILFKEMIDLKVIGFDSLMLSVTCTV